MGPACLNHLAWLREGYLLAWGCRPWLGRAEGLSSKKPSAGPALWKVLEGGEIAILEDWYLHGFWFPPGVLEAQSLGGVPWEGPCPLLLLA